MNAKEYLRQLRRITVQLENLEKELSEFERARIYMRSPQIDGDRVMTSPSGDPPFLADTMRSYEIREKVNRKWDEMINLKHEIIEKINSLSDARHIKLLSLRYVDFKSFEQIAVEMNYSFEYVLKLHGRALEAFKEVIDEDG